MKTIVLLHGFPLDAGMWEPQRDALENAGFHVITPTMPFFGPPPLAVGRNAADYPLLQAPALEVSSMESWARKVNEIIVHEAGGKAIVAGLSMGGYVLMALLRAHPEAVRAAIFLDTKAAEDSPEPRVGRLKMIEDVKAHGTAGVIQTMLPKLLTPQADEGVRKTLRTIMARQRPEAVCGAQWAMAHRRDQTDLLPSLEIPTLFIAGAADALTTPAMMAQMAEQARGKFVEIPRAGHQSNLEQPDAVNAALTAFVTGI